LGGILDDRAKSLRLLCVDRIVPQQIAVLLHGGAAAGSVDDDGIDISIEESVNVLSGHCLGRDTFTVVRVQSAAASLSLRKDDFATVSSEHADRGFIHVAEEQRHHAAVEHRHFGAPVADGGQNTRIRRKETW
jgi:hypothetical protein